MRTCLLFALSCCFATAGCTTNTNIAEEPSADGGHGDAPSRADAQDTGPACRTSADCQSDEVCGFQVSAGCGARGVCLPSQSPCAIEATAGCGCDGSQVNLTSCNDFLPGGYALKPVAYAGACLSCPGAMIEAGAVGASCAITEQCNPGELCAWPMSQSCPVDLAKSLPGTCVPMVEGCHCVPPPACGCDGKEAMTGCSVQLPFGYSLSPFAHVGACTDGGTCGNGTCDDGENCATCPADCGECPDGG